MSFLVKLLSTIILVAGLAAFVKFGFDRCVSLQLVGAPELISGSPLLIDREISSEEYEFWAISLFIAWATGIFAALIIFLATLAGKYTWAFFSFLLPGTALIAAAFALHKWMDLSGNVWPDMKAGLIAYLSITLATFILTFFLRIMWSPKAEKK